MDKAKELERFQKALFNLKMDEETLEDIKIISKMKHQPTIDAVGDVLRTRILKGFDVDQRKYDIEGMDELFKKMALIDPKTCRDYKKTKGDFDNARYVQDTISLFHKGYILALGFVLAYAIYKTLDEFFLWNI